MYLIKYGVRFYSNKYDDDILIFKNIDELRLFKNTIITLKDHKSNRVFIRDMVNNLQKFNSMDLKRRKDYFVDDIVEQIILGNHIFNMINMENYFIAILDEVIDPFINEFS